MRSVPRITVDLRPELNLRLRKYIFEQYPANQYGKLRRVIDRALTEFLDKRGY